MDMVEFKGKLRPDVLLTLLTKTDFFFQFLNSFDRQKFHAEDFEKIFPSSQR